MLLYSFNILQDHRGQAGAGALLANPKRIKDPIKDRGPARASVPFKYLQQMSDHTAFAGLAHTCYAKNRFLTRENIHPLPVGSKKYDMYVASDGILLDIDVRRQALKDAGYRFESDTNGAVIGTMFARYMDETGDEFEAGRRVIEDAFGCGVFSAVMLARRKKDGKTKIVALKDKRACKPMCYGVAHDTMFVASETYPLQHFGVGDIRNARGGDVIVFSEDGCKVRNFGDSRLEMPCIFERIYFGGPEALVLEELGPKFSEYAKRLGRKVGPGYRPSNFTVRNCLGLAWHDFWKDSVTEPDLISAVVDSGIGVTRGIAAGFHIPAYKYLDSLIKTLALKTFQISNPEERWLEVMLKEKLITDLLEGIYLIIGDDSVVKGGMSGRSVYVEEMGGSPFPGGGSERTFFPSKSYGIIGQLKRIGKVARIVMGISYAPMPFQCFYEFEVMEKRAAQASVGKPLIEVCDDVSKILEPDWKKDRRLNVRYNPLGNVYAVCGRHNCAACANGCYPVNDRFIPAEIKERRERFTDSA
jgi:glutamine phosphoribosylpyrophosphate amidotransferase